jgi:hypothetical protein
MLIATASRSVASRILTGILLLGAWTCCSGMQSADPLLRSHSYNTQERELLCAASKHDQSAVGGFSVLAAFYMEQGESMQ